MTIIGTGKYDTMPKGEVFNDVPDDMAELLINKGAGVKEGVTKEDDTKKVK